jgi:5-methylthioadenosine/S-adenosylhomocysteine deaminase
MKYDTIIHNGTIITVDKSFALIDDGFICIRDGKIEIVAPRPPDLASYNADIMIDAGGGIVMPGLVNTHTHLPMTLLRGIADDIPLFEWLNKYIFPLEAKYMSPDNVKLGSLLGCAEMLLSGTTTCCDGYFHENDTALAALETGIRGVFGQGVIDFPAPGIPDPSDNIRTAGLFIENLKNLSPLVTPSVFCHSPYTCSEETLKKAKDLARSHNLLFQIHTAETKNEFDMIMSKQGLSPVKYLESAGILDEMTMLIHAVWLEKDDIRIISEHGAKVSHNPQSNMKLASGIAPAPELIKNNITVGLGTDGCASNNDPDMFKEMDVAAKIHKARLLDPTVMDAKKVVQMATIRGAEAIGLGNRIGSIEKGKDADIIIIDTRLPHMVPMYNPVSHIVYSATGSDIKDVFVGGRQIVNDGKILTLELDDILDKTNAVASRIKKERVWELKQE